MLTESQLVTLLNSSESRLIERKEAQPKDSDIRKVLVAFANSVEEGEHAVLFIGITDKGVRYGVKDADKTQRQIRQVAENDCYPPVKCEPSVIKESGIEIVAIIVPMSKNRPHFAGHAYLRRGSENVKASSQIFDEMVASRNDKARRILSAKNELISVEFIRREPYVPSSSEFKAPRREDRDYKIEECDAHFVKFKDRNLGFIYSPSLEHVAIGRDAVRDRLKLIVRENP